MNQRRASLTSPLTRVYKQVLALMLRPFSGLSQETREIIGFCALVAATTLLLARPTTQALPENYAEGEIVRRTVTAPDDLSIADPGENGRRQDALNKGQK